MSVIRKSFSEKKSEKIREVEELWSDNNVDAWQLQPIGLIAQIRVHNNLQPDIKSYPNPNPDPNFTTKRHTIQLNIR